MRLHIVWFECRTLRLNSNAERCLSRADGNDEDEVLDGAEGTIRGGALFASMARIRNYVGIQKGGTQNVGSPADGPPPQHVDARRNTDLSPLPNEDSGDRGSRLVIPASAFQMLWDLLPLPVFIRDRQGLIAYANKAGSHIAGCESGTRPAAWQLTPRQGPADSFASPVPNDGIVGEHDLPRQPSSPQHAVPTLPPASSRYHMIILHSVSLEPARSRTSVLHVATFSLLTNWFVRAGSVFSAEHRRSSNAVLDRFTKQRCNASSGPLRWT